MVDKQRTLPELLAPAGDMERLKMAVLYGADAVYLAGTSFGMRSFAGNFAPEELPKAVKFAHDHGVRVHVTVNTMPRNDEVARLPEHLERLNDAGVDALILADLGAFTLAGKYAPKCERHISTQQSIANYECARAWYDLGAKRVVLAREVSLQEIREMRAKIPAELEIETFCHGAMCVSYSGRCLLSNYMTGRDSNRGACAQPCRYQYALMEEKRPGEYFPVFEDEKGTYIMNSKDLRAIAHVERLTKMGVHSLKIEGRTKSFYYCARTAQVYRKAIDDAAAGKPFDTSLLETLEGLAHRGYTEGFLRRHTHDDYQNYEYGYSVSDRQQFVGEFTGERKGDLAAVAVKNKFSVGDSLELMTPQGNINFTLEHMENAKGEAMPIAPGDGYTVWLPVPQDLELNYALLMRNFSGETTRNPHGK